MNYLKVARRDVAQHKGITLVVALFVAAAALLVSAATTLALTLGGSIDSLMQQAETPHFMQMHSGPVDRVRLSAFAAGNELVVEHQLVEFLNIDGAAIVMPGGTLAESVQDNGVTAQNEHFDYLLDLHGNRVTVRDAEIYVPITYLGTKAVEVGESITVAGREFSVAGFLRDSQMNSLLSSSKRFLVSERDFEALREHGAIEYLIEFRLTDLGELGAFEAAYAAAGLEANGPTLTYPLFRMPNALSDGLLIAVILLVSALVVGVAFLCIRFALVAKIEEDYREIGVMKAIGLRLRDIKAVYLAQYGLIAAAGSTAGFALSFVAREPLLANIRLAMGETERSALAPLVAGIAVALVFLAIVAYVNRVLRRFATISPAQAVRFGIAQERHGARLGLRLSRNRLWNTQLFLGLKDVVARRKLYTTMLAVLVLASFIVIVPQNLHETVSSEHFVAHMGTGVSHIRIDVQQTDNVLEKTDEIVRALEQDDDVARFAATTTTKWTVLANDGTPRRLRVDVGDHSVFPLTYATGRAPEQDDEIALSVLNADELGAGVGDVLTQRTGFGDRRLTISGVYSDVTNGGRTAKAAPQGTQGTQGTREGYEEVMATTVSIAVADWADRATVVENYANWFPYAKVSDIHEFVMQTYGPTLDSIATASRASVAIALVLAALITVLFVRMLVAKDRYSTAVMKSLGYRDRDIKAQYLARALVVLTIGTVGEMAAGALIASFGASSFSFEIDPIRVYGFLPALLAAVVLAATMLGSSDAGAITLSQSIKES